MRVGGRLKNSNLAFNACHPILLLRKHILTQRIIEREHTKLTRGFARHDGFHASALLAAIIAIPHGIIQKCITCFKAKPNQSEVLMDSLPGSRVNISRLFSRCGVDYAGPLLLRKEKHRNARSHKLYVSLFVCFITKAIHLQLVSDLTSETFIAAIKWFISHRDRSAHMYLDNGTTFVSAHRQIQELYDIYNDQQVQSELKDFLRELEISWSFIPPHLILKIAVKSATLARLWMVFLVLIWATSMKISCCSGNA